MISWETLHSASIKVCKVQSTKWWNGPHLVMPKKAIQSMHGLALNYHNEHTHLWCKMCNVGSTCFLKNSWNVDENNDCKSSKSRPHFTQGAVFSPLWSFWPPSSQSKILFMEALLATTTATLFDWEAVSANQLIRDQTDSHWIRETMLSWSSLPIHLE